MLTENKVHKTRLKEQLLVNVPDLQAYKHDHDMYLAFNRYLGPSIAKNDSFYFRDF